MKCSNCGEVISLHQHPNPEVERLLAENDQLRAAILHVRAIIKDGALTGFNCKDGDWPERLFASQAVTYAALIAEKDAKP